MQFKLTGPTQGLLALLFVCAPLAGAEYQDPPHVTPAVGVTARPGTTGTKADGLPNATGWDAVPLADTAAGLPDNHKIRVLARSMTPPAGRVFAQYPVDKKWYDSIPGDTDGFPAGDFTPPGPNSISVYRTFFNTKVPDANNFPWRLEGNLAGGAGGGQSHWGAKVNKPALPGDLAFVFSDRPKIGTGNAVYVGVLIIPSQSIVDGLANGGYIITKRTQTYTLNGQQVTEVVYYGGIIPANLDADNSVYYGQSGSHLGGPHMTSDGRIALEYDVLINDPVNVSGQPLASPISVAMETKVFAGNPPNTTFATAVQDVPVGDRNRSGRLDKNEGEHKSNAFFGTEDQGPALDTLLEGTTGSTLLKTASCSVTLPNTGGYTSVGIQDPPADVNLRVTRPVNMGSGRYENATAIPKQ